MKQPDRPTIYIQSDDLSHDVTLVEDARTATKLIANVLPISSSIYFSVNQLGSKPFCSRSFFEALREFSRITGCKIVLDLNDFC